MQASIEQRRLYIKFKNVCIFFTSHCLLCYRNVTKLSKQAVFSDIRLSPLDYDRIFIICIDAENSVMMLNCIYTPHFDTDAFYTTQ